MRLSNLTKDTQPGIRGTQLCATPAGSKACALSPMEVLLHARPGSKHFVSISSVTAHLLFSLFDGEGNRGTERVGDLPESTQPVLHVTAC